MHARHAQHGTILILPPSLANGPQREHVVMLSSMLSLPVPMRKGRLFRDSPFIVRWVTKAYLPTISFWV